MKELVKILVDAGMEKPAAEKKVKELLAKVKALRPDDPEDKVYAITKLKVTQFANAVKRSGAKAFRGTVLGYSEYRDIYAGYKQTAIAEYNKDPRAAVDQGIVKVEGEKIIALDTRETLPSGDPNPRYGQPIPEIWRRDVFLEIDGQLTRVFGDIADEPKIGGVYAFAGLERENAISLSRIRPWMLEKELTKEELWKVALDVLEPYAVDIGGISDWHTKHVDDVGRIAAIKGVVMFATEASTGNYLIVVDDIDDPGEGIPTFVPPAMAQSVGVEVIAFGRTFQTTTPEGEERVGLNGFGVIANPETETVAELFDELDEILWEG